MIGKPCPAPYKGYTLYVTPPMKDGRARVYLVNRRTNKRLWLQLAKYKLEVKRGKRLGKNEQVDHKNGDHTDDRLRNLQVLTRNQHATKTHKQNGTSQVWRTLKCPVCKIKFSRRAHRVDHVLRIGKQPACSRSCGARKSSLGC